MKRGWWIPGVCALMLLSGCSTTPQRTDPYSVPQYAEPDSMCRDINGSYNALPHPLGEAQRATRPLLALTLLPPQAVLSQASKVTLEREEDGALQVMALGSDGRVLAKRRYADGTGVFECDDGRLEFHPRRLAAGDSEGISWETVVLRKATDGSLILRKGGLLSGLAFMVFPMSVSTDDWYLFKPLP